MEFAPFNVSFRSLHMKTSARGGSAPGRAEIATTRRARKSS